MNRHHTITEKINRDATKSHPYLSRHLGNGMEVVQFKAIQTYYTYSAQCVIKLFNGYFLLINRRAICSTYLIKTAADTPILGVAAVIFMNLHYFIHASRYSKQVQFRFSLPRKCEVEMYCLQHPF